MTETTPENKPLPFTLVMVLITCMFVLALLGWAGVATLKELTSAGVQALASGAFTLSLKAVLK